MARKQLSASERWAVEMLERYRLYRLIAKFVGAALIAFVAIALPVYWGAGEATVISLVYKVIVEGDLADKVWRGLVVVLVLLLFWQRWSYAKRLNHLGGRIKHMEQTKDPGRSSSNPKP